MKNLSLFTHDDSAKVRRTLERSNHTNHSHGARVTQPEPSDTDRDDDADHSSPQKTEPCSALLCTQACGRAGPAAACACQRQPTPEIWLVCELYCGLLHLSERELRDCLARLGWPSQSGGNQEQGVLPSRSMNVRRTGCCMRCCKVMRGLVTVHVQQWERILRTDPQRGRRAGMSANTRRLLFSRQWSAR